MLVLKLVKADLEVIIIKKSMLKPMLNGGNIILKSCRVDYLKYDNCHN